MKFKYSVIGNNTPKNREWLEKLGYELLYNGGAYGEVIVTDSFTKEYYYIKKNIALDTLEKHETNCLHSDDLFKAVAAIRDDNDSNQWFTDGKSWMIASEITVDGVEISDYSEYFKGYHKATLEELINHFK